MVTGVGIIIFEYLYGMDFSLLGFLVCATVLGLGEVTIALVIALFEIQFSYVSLLVFKGPIVAAVSMALPVKTSAVVYCGASTYHDRI